MFSCANDGRIGANAQPDAYDARKYVRTIFTYTRRGRRTQDAIKKSTRHVRQHHRTRMLFGLRWLAGSQACRRRCRRSRLAQSTLVQCESKNTRNDDLAAKRCMVGVSGQALATKRLLTRRVRTVGRTRPGVWRPGALSTVTSNCQYPVQRETLDAKDIKKGSEIETHRKTKFGTKESIINIAYC